MRTSLLNVITVVIIVLAAKPAHASELIFTFDQLRVNKGYVLCTLHNKKETFPRDAAKALISKHAIIKTGRAVCRFENLPPGQYAATFGHDENRNKEVDIGALGLPLEGFAFSRNAKPGFFGPPDFEEATIALGQGGHAEEIFFIYP